MMEAPRCLDFLRELTVLYVEDEESIRSEMSHFLAPRVGKLLLAGNGREGLEIYQARRPDVVLSDIQMPVMDGLAMTEAIKYQHSDTPVVLITAFNDPQYLQRAIALGVNGYALKPVNLEVLMTTLSRAVEMLMQTRELATSRAQLDAYHDAAEQERHLVAQLMARMMHPENLRDSQVRYWLRPTEVVGGDLIAVARSRNGKLYVMLADSTGHGLPAALNLLPINHIFYSMVSKNLPVSLMVEEMNWAVRDQSPAERYVAALVACIDTRNRLVEVWNGGIPCSAYIDDGGSIARSFDSCNLPLGILDRTFTAQTEIYQWLKPGHLVIHSDGLAEAENDAGEEFGSQRVVEVLCRASPAQRFEALQQAVTQHLGARRPFDDMSLLMVASQPPP